MFNSATFNNSGSSSISGWYAPLCADFANMFRSANNFNQPLTNLVDTSTFSGTVSLTGMFQSSISFNQDLGSWKLNRAGNLSSMFNGTSRFNNGDSNSISGWRAPVCTNFSSMFQSATNFNQPLTNLVATSGLSGNCTLSSMFNAATIFNQPIGSWDVSKVSNMASMFTNARSFNQYIGDWNTINVTGMNSMFAGSTTIGTVSRFNNGQTGLTSIPSVIAASASYSNINRLLSYPNTDLVSNVSIGDVLVIETASQLFSSDILSVSGTTNLILSLTFAASIPQGNIISIQRQLSGTAPLNWNTSNVVNMINMFQNCPFFNQTITTSGTLWNTNQVTNFSNIFAGPSTSIISLFNNGETILGNSAPMNWNISPLAITTNFRNNCRLTNGNKPTLV
jgi:hypothetical protein